MIWECVFSIYMCAFSIYNCAFSIYICVFSIIYLFSYSQINCDVKSEIGNPFLTTGHELVAIDTRDVRKNVVAMSLSKFTEIGKTLHSEYVDANATVPVSNTVKETVCSRLAIVQTHERMERRL